MMLSLLSKWNDWNLPHFSAEKGKDTEEMFINSDDNDHYDDDDDILTVPWSTPMIVPGVVEQQIFY